MKNILAFILPFLFILSCQSNSVRPGNVLYDQGFNIKTTETVTVNNELKITLDKMTDSRCPEGVQCVRAGDLFATFTFENQVKVDKIDFCLSGDCLNYVSTNAPRTFLYSGEGVEVNGKIYELSINDFSPTKATQNMKQTDYVLNVAVNKRK